MTTRNRLSKMTIKKISLVDRGAHQDAEVVIAKRDDAEDSEMDVNTSRFTDRQANGKDRDVAKRTDSEVEDFGYDDEDETPRRKRRKSDLTKNDDRDDQPEVITEEILKTLPAAARSYIENLEDTIVNLVSKTDDDGVDDDEEDDEEDDDDAEAKADSDDGDDTADDADAKADDKELASAGVEKFLKSDAPAAQAIRKALDDARQEAASAKKIAKRERDLRVHRETVEKAATFSPLPVKEDEMVTLLKALGERAPELVSSVEKIFGASAALIRESDLFTESGVGVHNDATVIAKLDQKVDAIRKEHPELTAEQAEVMLLEEHPELYAEYLSDHPSTLKGN